MAYYTALITAWNSSIQPPTGVIGTGLSSAQSTATKLANVNGWTVTGAIPTNFTVVGSDLANCVNWTEFAALTATQQSNLLGLFRIAGPLLGGSANTSLLTDGMILASFPTSGVTIANLTALAKSVTLSWAQTNGYNYLSSFQGNINGGDLAAANSSIGGLT
jgi:hypothetical protein